MRVLQYPFIGSNEEAVSLTGFRDNDTVRGIAVESVRESARFYGRVSRKRQQFNPWIGQSAVEPFVQRAGKSYSSSFVQHGHFPTRNGRDTDPFSCMRVKNVKLHSRQACVALHPPYPHVRAQQGHLAASQSDSVVAGLNGSSK